MVNTQDVSKDSVVVILNGGRLPSWDSVSAEEKKAFEQEHVNLMLSIAREHRMQRLEGYKLMAPQDVWVRSWLIEFPTLDGAEAWIEAEMAPPYGRYGYFEYYVSRRWKQAELTRWVTRPAVPVAPSPETDPHRIPPLDVDLGSVVLWMFERPPPEAGRADLDAGTVERLQSVAREHNLMRLDAFQSIAPQPDWQRLWLTEFPDLAGAEAWIEVQTQPPYGVHIGKSFQLTRKWAPEYFVNWIAP